MPSTAEIPAPSPETAPPVADRSRPLPTWWPWAVGLLLGLVIMGPGLGGGSLLSLDLLVTPHIPVPNGMYGLGPALSQRVPMFALLGLGSALVGGPVTTKVLLVLFVAAGFAGAARLARTMGPSDLRVGVAGQALAGLLWAGGPFALTRIGAGHVNLVWVVAVLPWALPRLCRPADHLAATFLASLALAIGGPGGGTLGIAVAVLALAVQPRRRGRIARPLVAVLAPHLVWVVPTVVLLWAGAGVTGAGGFATHASGAAGWPALAVGSGFWRADYQVGATGWLGGVAGLVVAALAVIGGLRSARAGGRGSWPATACVVAAVGLALAVASAVPGVRAGYDALSDLPFGAPLRESHRFLALWLVVAGPAAAVGAAAVAELRWTPRLGAGRGRALAALGALALVVAVSASGWWGIDGRLEPVDYPSGWAVVRTEVRRQPGTVVAFPWNEYPSLSFLGGRQAFNPLPDYLGGDVISSYDPGFDPDHPHQEQVDQRAVVVDRLSTRATEGHPIGDQLARLGVRWVVVVRERDAERYRSLYADPGLRRTLSLPDVDLYEVAGWSGRATAPDGSPHPIGRPVPPILTTDAPAGSVLNVSGAPGWVQGWSTPVQVTADGRLRITGDGGVLWFWPAPLILAVDVAVAVLAIGALRSCSDRFGRILASRARRG